MNNPAHELYRSGVTLAKRLGYPVESVPLPFQLTELENYVKKLNDEAIAKSRPKS